VARLLLLWELGLGEEEPDRAPWSKIKLMPSLRRAVSICISLAVVFMFVSKYRPLLRRLFSALELATPNFSRRDLQKSYSTST